MAEVQEAMDAMREVEAWQEQVRSLFQYPTGGVGHLE